MEEAEDKFGKKGTARAGLTLGIIGTALAALGNNNGCGCGSNGILGGLFGGNNNGCAMQAAEQAKTLAMAQGQMADNLSWANRVQSLQDDVDLYTYINGQTRVLSDQNYQGRITDIGEKCNMYVDLLTRDNAQNLRLCDELYKRREQDIQEKSDLFARLAAMQQMQQKQGSSSILEEINKVVSGMSSDEQAMMSESPEYIMAKQTYEAGFMGFLGQKFSQEYVNTQEGKTAANNLLNSIKRIKDKVSEDLKAKQKKVDELIHLLENDPELKKRYEELSIGK